MSMQGDSQWHLDRRVPIALIFTLLMQTVAAVWWAATMSARVDALDRQINALNDNPSRILRVEERQQAISSRLARIEAIQRRMDSKLDKLLLRGGPR